MSSRRLPNILVTGTPGVGKSTLCQQLCERTGLTWLNVGDIAKSANCLEGYDEQYDCPVLNEDKLLDILESRMCDGGKVVDYHGCDFFPRRWFDIVFVLRTDNTTLFDRLKKRGYSGRKLEDNIDCEIFQTLLDEARESYDEEIVHQLTSNSLHEVSLNVDRIIQWLTAWKYDNGVLS